MEHGRGDRDRRGARHREAPEPDAVGDDGVADAEALPAQQALRGGARTRRADQSIATAVRRLIATIAAPSLPIAPAAKPGVTPCHAKQPASAAASAKHAARAAPLSGRNTRQLKTPSEPAPKTMQRCATIMNAGAHADVERHRLARHRGERVAEAAHQEEAEAEHELGQAARARGEEEHPRSHHEAHEDEGRHRRGSRRSASGSSCLPTIRVIVRPPEGPERGCGVEGPAPDCLFQRRSPDGRSHPPRRSPIASRSTTSSSGTPPRSTGRTGSSSTPASSRTRTWTTPRRAASRAPTPRCGSGSRWRSRRSRSPCTTTRTAR